MGKLFRSGLLLSAGLFLLIGVSEHNSAFAQENQNATYCSKGERFFPDGKIVKIASRYFRFCNSYATLGSDGNGLSVRASALNDTVIQEEFASLNYVMSIRNQSYSKGVGNTFRRRIEIATVNFGEASYRVMVLPNRYSRGLERISRGGMPDPASFQFDGPTSLNVPAHFVSCFGDPVIEPREQFHCFIRIRYLQDDNIVILNRLIWNPKLVEGTSFRLKPPFDFDNLIWQIRGIEQIVRSMDVTEQIGKFRGKVDTME